MGAIEEDNPQLKGVLPRTYQELSNSTLVSLVRSVNAIRVAEELLASLKRSKPVIGWRQAYQTRAAVRLAVEETLERLPEKFTRQLNAPKCDAVYQHVFVSYFDDGRSVYDRAA